jgi:AcrR family transcriptional regulator
VTEPNRAKRKPLDRVTIVEAGIALADDEGVGALTMRRLAERLGFKVMALYNHVANKDELLASMVDAVAGSIDQPSSDEPAMQAARAHAIATRQALVRHSWAPALWQQYLPGPNRIDHMESLLRILNTSGLPEDLAHHGFHALNNHVLGYTLQELAVDFDSTAPDAHAIVEEFLATTSSETHPHTVAHVHEHLNGNTASSFELVLDLILDGLVRLQADR